MTKSSIHQTILCAASSVLIAGLFTSCVSTKNVPLSGADRAAMRGKTLAVTTREKPHHFVMKQSAMAAASLGGAIGGAIAGSIAEKEGQEQIQKHRIANPDDLMSREVTKSLVAKTGAKVVPGKAITKSLDPAKVVAENSGARADYVLDCFTTNWMGTYYPFSIGKYFMMFGAKMQLMETSTGRVVAEGYSVRQDKDREHAPDYDGIYSNDAYYLKSETKKGTDAAVSKFTGLF